MIKLYAFGSMPGLPDMSPFVVKAMTLLKMAGAEYTVDLKGFRRAPKGKLPYFDDNGVIVADSTFIRQHLEKARGVDFDAGLSAQERAQGWALERLCEDHLLWIIARDRWQDDDNFAHGVGPFFDKLLPALGRGAIKWMLRRSVVKRLWQIGVGRFNNEELAVLGARDVEALATQLGDKPYLFGDKPCGADATAFAMINLLLDPTTAGPTRDAAMTKPNLVAYRDRMMRQYFPDVGAA